MYQRGYPSHSMTGGYYSVVSICLTCHDVYTPSGHRSDERFSAADFWLQSMSSVDRDFKVMIFSEHARWQRNGNTQTERARTIRDPVFGGESSTASCRHNNSHRRSVTVKMDPQISSPRNLFCWKICTNLFRWKIWTPSTLFAKKFGRTCFVEKFGSPGTY